MGVIDDILSSGNTGGTVFGITFSNSARSLACVFPWSTEVIVEANVALVVDSCTDKDINTGAKLPYTLVELHEDVQASISRNLVQPAFKPPTLTPFVPEVPPPPTPAPAPPTPAPPTPAPAPPCEFNIPAPPVQPAPLAPEPEIPRTTFSVQNIVNSNIVCDVCRTSSFTGYRFKC